MLPAVRKLPFIVVSIYFTSLFLEANSLLPNLVDIPKLVYKTKNAVNDVVPLDKGAESAAGEPNFREASGENEALEKKRQKRKTADDCKERSRTAELAMLNTIKKARHYEPLELGSTLMGDGEKGSMHGMQTLANATEVFVKCNKTALAMETLLDMYDVSVIYKWLWKVQENRFGKVWMYADDVDLEVIAVIDRDTTKNPTVKINSVLLTAPVDFKFGHSGADSVDPPIKVSTKELYENVKLGPLKAMDAVMETILKDEYLKLCQQSKS